MGLDVYLLQGKDRGYERDSFKYPNHYFKIGYFRSSYNEWGLNSILRKTIDKDLYYIFEPPEGKSDFKPKWEKCRTRCIEVIEEFENFISKTGNNLVMRVSARIFDQDTLPQSEKEAMDLYTKIKNDRDSGSFKSFLNRDGQFYLDGIKCYAFIYGKDAYGKECVYVVYEPELEENEKNEVDPSVYKDYVRCLEIVLETIEYVLGNPASERKKFSLHWSA